MTCRESRRVKIRSLLILISPLLLGLAVTPVSSAEVSLKVLNPRAEIPPPSATPSLSPRVPGLDGKRIGLIANHKAGAELFLTKIEELLEQKYSTAKIVRLRMGKNYSEMAAQIDTFVHSTGD